MYITIGLIFAIIYAFIIDSKQGIIDPEDLRPDSFTEFETVRTTSRKLFYSVRGIDIYDLFTVVSLLVSFVGTGCLVFF